MPFYEYECETCETVTEREFPICDSPQQVPCRECGKPAKKIISVSHFRLKGNWPTKNFKKGLDYD